MSEIFKRNLASYYSLEEVIVLARDANKCDIIDAKTGLEVHGVSRFTFELMSGLEGPELYGRVYFPIGVQFGTGSKRNKVEEAEKVVKIKLLLASNDFEWFRTKIKDLAAMTDEFMNRKGGGIDTSKIDIVMNLGGEFGSWLETDEVKAKLREDQLKGDK